mgnify:CR=1 FL=1
MNPEVILILLALLPALTGCSKEGQNVRRDIPTVLYIVRKGLQTGSLSADEDTSELTFTVYKAGYNEKSVETILTVNEYALDRFNENNGTNFLQLPSQYFSLDTGMIKLDNYTYSKQVKVTFDAEAIITNLRDGKRYAAPISLGHISDGTVNIEKYYVIIYVRVP